MSKKLLIALLIALLASVCFGAQKRRGLCSGERPWRYNVKIASSDENGLKTIATTALDCSCFPSGFTVAGEMCIEPRYEGAK